MCSDLTFRRVLLPQNPYRRSRAREVKDKMDTPTSQTARQLPGAQKCFQYRMILDKPLPESVDYQGSKKARGLTYQTFRETTLKAITALAGQEYREILDIIRKRREGAKMNPPSTEASPPETGMFV